jgi:hypothetical protein
MPAATLCPKCQKRYRSENHLCQPSALKKLAPMFEAQRKAQQTSRR